MTTRGGLVRGRWSHSIVTRLVVIACFAVLVMPFTACRARRRERVTVLAAASTGNALTEISDLFNKSEPAVEVVVATGPSNGLAQQILAGAEADVFVSASPRWVDAVAHGGMVAERVDLLTNRLVLIVPRGNPAGVSSLADLMDPSVNFVALAGENVPAGMYADQALEAAGLLGALRDSHRLARGSDVRAALAYVERGEADAGIVYATDARISDQVEVVAELDPASHTAIVYPVALLRGGANRAASSRYFQFLRSEAARDVFEKRGFTMLDVAARRP